MQEIKNGIDRTHLKSAIHKSRLSAKVNIRQTDGLLCNKFMVDY